MTPLRMLTTFAKYLTSRALASQTMVWGCDVGENWMPSCNACSRGQHMTLGWGVTRAGGVGHGNQRRQNLLGKSLAFTCSCEGCTNPNPELGNIHWGLC